MFRDEYRFRRAREKHERTATIIPTAPLSLSLSEVAVVGRESDGIQARAAETKFNTRGWTRGVQRCFPLH